MSIVNLVIASHPDDETLGCGGSLLKGRSRGEKNYWLIITGMPEGEAYGPERIRERREEIEAVTKRYGFEEVFNLEFPAAGLDTVPMKELVGRIASVLQKVGPDVLYVPNAGDVHSDHKIVFEAAISASKTFRLPSLKKTLVYETVSETEFAPALPAHYFVPNSFSDISDYLEEKISVMELYKGELAEHPFPRSAENIRALAAFRGATSGVRYAEAFMLLKEIW